MGSAGRRRCSISKIAHDSLREGKKCLNVKSLEGEKVLQDPAVTASGEERVRLGKFGSILQDLIQRRGRSESGPGRGWRAEGGGGFRRNADRL